MIGDRVLSRRRDDRLRVRTDGRRGHAVPTSWTAEPCAGADNARSDESGQAPSTENAHGRDQVGPSESASEIRRMIDSHRAGRRDYSLHIWSLLVFQTWMDLYL
jgi:hypothetical protein